MPLPLLIFIVVFGAPVFFVFTLMATIIAQPLLLGGQPNFTIGLLASGVITCAVFGGLSYFLRTTKFRGRILITSRRLIHAIGRKVRIFEYAEIVKVTKHERRGHLGAVSLKDQRKGLYLQRATFQGDLHRVVYLLAAASHGGQLLQHEPEVEAPASWP
jgi:hypothetical protein